jgi:hypothetical protein
MSGGAGLVFDGAGIKQCVDEGRPLEVPVAPGAQAYFGGDLAFESDSSGLVGVGILPDGRFDVLVLEEMRPGRGVPLKPRAVIDQFASILKRYRATAVMADAHYRASAKEHLEPHGIRFLDAPSGNTGKRDVYMKARELIHEGRVRLPNHPRLLAQLRSVVQKPIAGGGLHITSPRRAGSGGHGDLVSALVLALWSAARGAKRPRRASSGESRGEHRPQPATYTSPMDVPGRGFFNRW